MYFPSTPLPSQLFLSEKDMADGVRDDMKCFCSALKGCTGQELKSAGVNGQLVKLWNDSCMCVYMCMCV